MKNVPSLSQKSRCDVTRLQNEEYSCHVFLFLTQWRFCLRCLLRLASIILVHVLCNDMQFTNGQRIDTILYHAMVPTDKLFARLTTHIGQPRSQGLQGIPRERDCIMDAIYGRSTDRLLLLPFVLMVRMVTLFSEIVSVRAYWTWVAFHPPKV